MLHDGRRMTRRKFLGGALSLPLLSIAQAQTGKAAATTAATGRWNMVGETPHLIVHYMPWFGITHTPQDEKPVWEHWKWDGPNAHHDPDKRLPNGQRDIASVYYPLIGPYNVWSRSVVRYHMETIRAMGADGVALDWYGLGHFTDQSVALLLDEAHRADLRLTLCYDEKINFVWPAIRDPKTRADAVATATKDLNYLLQRYAPHPAFMRRDGKPFFFQFNASGQGKLGPHFFSAEEDAEIFAHLSEPVVFGRQGLQAAYTPTAPCRFLWFAGDGPAIRKFAGAAREMIDKGQMQFFMGFISPGFDDTGVWGWNNKPRVTPRQGLDFLNGTFTNAFAGDPELIQAVTWNDFQEGTVLEPTREFGFHYADALATWWAQKKGRTADLTALRKPFLAYAATCSTAEKAELPPAPYEPLLIPKPLTVDDPTYIEHRSKPAT